MPWSAEILDPSLEVVFFLRIEGIPYWIFTRLPDATWAAPSGVTFVDGLRVPGSFDQSLDPFDVVARAGHLRAEFNDLLNSAGQYFFTRLFATGLGSDASQWTAYLAGDLAPRTGATSMVVTNSVGALPALEFDAYVGLETVRVTASAVGADTTTLTVVRGRYTAGADPSVAALPQRHRYRNDDDEATPTTRVASWPYAWYNRRVSLYATWVDRVTSTFGGKSGAASVPTLDGTHGQLLWSGRVVRADFGAATDTWALDCRPLLDDLDRPLLPRAATGVLTGIELRGVPAEERTIQLGIAGTGGGTVNEVLTAVIPEATYGHPLELVVAVDRAISGVVYNASNPTIQFSTNWGAVALGVDVRFQMFATHTTGAGVTAYRVSVWVPATLAVALGYAPWTATAGYRIPVADLSSARVETPTDWGRASQAMARVFWTPYASRLQLTESTSEFWTGGQSATLTTSWVWVDGRALVRTAGVGAGNSLATATASPGEQGVYSFNGPAVVYLPYGDGEASGNQVVAQAYVMPWFDGSGSVIRHLLQILVSTGNSFDGGGVPNGVHDVLRENMGLAVPAEYVDAASFLAVEDVLGEGVLYRSWVAFPGGEGLRFLDWATAEGALDGFYLVMSGGRITARAASWAPTPVGALALTESNKARSDDRTTWSLSPASLRNAAVLRYDWNYSTGEFAAEIQAQFRSSQESYEEMREIVVENRGLASPQQSVVEDLFASLSAQVYQYSNPAPVVSRTTSRDLFTRIVPGDVVTLTDSALPNHFTGGRGVTALRATVTRVSQRWQERSGQVDLLLEPLVPDSLRTPLAPAARVTAFNAVGNIATVAANEFTAAPATDASFFAVGDEVLVVEGGATNPAAPTNTQRTISAIAGNDVTLNGDLGGLVPATTPVYLTFHRRSTVTTSQVTRGTWIASEADNRIQDAYAAQDYVG